MVQLGQKVRDAITGFTGIVTARTEFLNGCVRVSVQPKPKKDKGVSVPESQVFDQEQLEVLDETPIRLPRRDEEAEDRGSTGGDRPDVARRRDPVQAAIARQNARLRR